MRFFSSGNVHMPAVGSADEAYNWAREIASWPPEERARKEKAYVRHIDRRIMPMLILMFILNYIDRIGLPAARLQGLEKDLGLQGIQYNVALSLFFIGYVLMQVPSNMMMAHVRPSLYLPGCMIIWGLVSGLTAAVSSFSGLAACRFILGITEAPFFPGAAFLLSGWYTKKELATRLGIFFFGAQISGAFGGLFAAGIFAAFQNHLYSPWRYLFIIEGSATIAVATLALFICPNWPSTTKWLSEEERHLGVTRMIEDAGDEDEEYTPRQGLILALTDWRVWLGVIGQLCAQAVASLTNFLPTLVSNFGYNATITLLLTAPPFCLSAFSVILNTYISDRRNNRSDHIIYPFCICAVGIIITLATNNVPVRYFALFLMVPGTYCVFQVSNAWVASVAARPKQKRAVALAFSNAVGNTGMAWTPYMYVASAGPRYVVAWSVNLALIAVGITVSVILRIVLVRANKAVDRAAGIEREDQKVPGVEAVEMVDAVEGQTRVTGVGRPLGGVNEGKVYHFQI